MVSSVFYVMTTRLRTSNNENKSSHSGNVITKLQLQTSNIHAAGEETWASANLGLHNYHCSNMLCVAFPLQTNIAKFPQSLSGRTERPLLAALHTHNTLHYFALHCIAIHSITIHYMILLYNTFSLHSIAMPYTTLRYTTLHYMTLNDTALQYTLHHIHSHRDTHAYRTTYLHTYIHVIYIRVQWTQVCARAESRPRRVSLRDTLSESSQSLRIMNCVLGANSRGRT